MKKIAIFTLSIIISLQVTAQENYKKCLTTPLVEKELIGNSDYAKSRANIISENKIWIKIDKIPKWFQTATLQLHY